MEKERDDHTLTLTVVPRVNVDGFDADVEDAFGRRPPWRQNYDPSSLTPCPAFYPPGRGFDINRYHRSSSTPRRIPWGPPAAPTRSPRPSP